MYLREILVYIFLLVSLLVGICAMYLHFDNSVIDTNTVRNPELQIKKAPQNTSPSIQYSSLDNNSNYIQGIDVSHWDGKISWSMVKRNGITFAFIKATEGDQFVDPQFATNWEQSSEASILRGAYHFYQPKDDPLSQANHFIKTISSELGDLPPVLDIEISDRVSADSLREDILVWLNHVEQQLGVRPMIYTDSGFWNAHIDDDFSYYELWIADWQPGPKPVLANGWTNWKFWQYSVKGKIKGIAGSSVDMNYCNCSLQDLKLAGDNW